MDNALCSRGKLPGRMEKLPLPAKTKTLQEPPTILRMCMNSFLSIDAGPQGTSSYTGGAKHKHVHLIVVM